MKQHSRGTPPSSSRVPRALKLGLLVAAVGIAIAPFAAYSADDIKYPVGYRNWFHVNSMVVSKDSPLFEGLGGMHNVYVNAKGLEALKNGKPYPNGTVFVSDVHLFEVTDGSYVEGDRKALATMVKDSKKYAATGGWGFQVWGGGDPKKPVVNDPAKQCFECHQPKKDQDYVYSTYLK